MHTALWHESGIFLQFPQWYTGVLSIRRHFWGEARCGHTREHGRMLLLSSSLLLVLLEVSAPWHQMNGHQCMLTTSIRKVR